jgi:hypothetical protein
MAEPHVQIRVIPQTDYNEQPRLLLTLKNFGAPLTVERWGFNMKPDDEHSRIICFDDAATEPYRLNTYDTRSVMLLPNHFKNVDDSEIGDIVGLCAWTSIGNIGCGEDAVTRFVERVKQYRAAHRTIKIIVSPKSAEKPSDSAPAP